MLRWVAQHKILLLIILFYFFIRSINLSIIPIFNDESIYLDWGWREMHQGNLYFSLYDGKQPFLMWIFGLFEGVISNPLIAGRIVSIIAGVFTLYGLCQLGKLVFTKNIGLLSAFLYTFIPVFSFFDRQALMESSVAATGIWIIYLFLKLLHTSSMKYAISLGIVLGIAFFIKSTVLLLVISLFIILIFYRKMIGNKVFFKQLGIAFLISQIVLLPLYSQSLYWQTLPMNNRYSMGIGDLIAFPFSTWIANLWAFLQISFWHLTPLVLAMIVFGCVVIMRKGTKKQQLLVWLFCIQIVFFIFVAKNVDVRYVMPMLPLGMLFATTCIFFFKKWVLPVFIIVVIFPIYMVYLQIFQPLSYFNQLNTLTSYSQKGTYVTSWTAGYATTQAIDYLQKHTKGKALVTVRLDAGNPENAIFAYFYNSQHIVPTYLGAQLLPNISNYDCLSASVPVYFVSRDTQLAGLDTYLQVEKRFYNPEKQTSVGVYMLNTKCKGKTLRLL